MHVYFKPHPYAALLPCEKKKSIKGEKTRAQSLSTALGSTKQWFWLQDETRLCTFFKKRELVKRTHDLGSLTLGLEPQVYF